MKDSLSVKKVCVKYFSRFAERVGKANDEYKTEANTLEDLWFELDKLYGFEQSINTVRPAINHQFCDWQERVSDGDIVSFIPPVSGG